MQALVSVRPRPPRTDSLDWTNAYMKPMPKTVQTLIFLRNGIWRLKTLPMGIANTAKSVTTFIHAWTMVFLYSLEQRLGLGGAFVHSASAAIATLSSAM